MDDGAVIRISGLSKRFGRGTAAVTALDEVSLEVVRGEVFGYLGPNGAGKTTTIRLLLGLLRPTSGSAVVFGRDSWRDATEIHQRVGYVPGEPAFYDRLTGLDHLRFYARLRGGVDPDHVRRLADRLGLDLGRAARSLSKGNRQKLALLQALMGRPDLLVLDEPTSGLDPLVKEEVHALFRDHAAAGGTVLLSSHALDEVQRTADRIGIIRAGRLIAVERLAELRARSLHHVTVRFAGPVDRTRTAAVPGLRDVAFDGPTLHCSAPADAMYLLVEQIARYRLADLSCQEADQEESFLAFYGEQARGAA